MKPEATPIAGDEASEQSAGEPNAETYFCQECPHEAADHRPTNSGIDEAGCQRCGCVTSKVMVRVDPEPSPLDLVPHQRTYDIAILQKQLGSAREQLAGAKATYYLSLLGIEGIEGHPRTHLKGISNCEKAVGRLEELLAAGMPSPEAKVLDLPGIAVPSRDGDGPVA